MLFRSMIAEGQRYTGFLYAGLMIDKAGNAKVLEFNCRLGDPETQPIMLRLKSDLVTLIEAAIDGKLDAAEAEWDRRAALGVVLAAHGYPDSPRKGDAITGIPEGTEDCHVFHAGTELRGEQVLTSGGRVLCVLNRKGRARLIACGACHDLARCEACGAAVSEIAGPDGARALGCPVCSLERPWVCARCHSAKLKSVRVGVNRVRDDLAALPIRELVARTGIDPASIDDVVLGNTNGAGEENQIGRAHV